MARKALHIVREQADRMVHDFKNKRQAKKLHKTEAKLQKAKEEEALLIEKQRAIQAERDCLMNMSQQELLAEAIMAIRGFYAEFLDMQNRIDDLESDISSLEAEIRSLEQNSFDAE